MLSLTRKKIYPIAYCINLDKEPEKYKKIKNEFDMFKIIRISAIDAKQNSISGTIALYNTNLELFRIIVNIQYKLPYVIIIEDDIYKYGNFVLYWPKILEFINNNNNWDFISLDFFLNFEKPKLQIYNNLFYRIEKSRSTGFMIYNTNFIKRNINYLSSCGCLDMTMKHNKNFIQLIPKELIVKQYVDKISHTANKMTEEYNEYYDLTEKYLQDNL